MSEPSAAPADEASAGMLLRSAREAAGLHVAALAVSLKVPVRKLEALEEDRYDLLPDAVFARALAASVCRSLKIDPQPVLERLPRSGKPRLGQRSDSINAPFRVPGEGGQRPWKEQLMRPVPLIVMALLFGALAVMLLPEWQEDAPVPAKRAEPVMPPSAPASVSVAPAEPGVQDAAAPQPSAALAPGMVAQNVPNATTVAAPAVAAATKAAPATAAPAPVPTALSASAAAAPGVSAVSSPAAVAAATGLVAFKTRAPSWVEVVDAKGQTVLRRLMEGGEAASVTGTVPLTVTIGSAGSTEVQVRGRPYDLRPVSRDNVARFEVK